MQIPVKLIGNVASPYTRKMIAYLRYKRIPYEVIWGQPEEVLKNMNIEAPKPVPRGAGISRTQIDPHFPVTYRVKRK